MVRDFVSCRARTPVDRGKVSGPLVADERASLSVLGLGCFQVLVRDADLGFQGIELGVLKKFPPVATEILVIRLGRFPIAHLFIGWRNFCLRPLIVGSNRATAKREYCYP